MDDRLEAIEKRLARIEEICDKMSNHVDFVERVYVAVRKPFSYLLGRKKDLPALIENKTDDIVKE
jgi:hypothetical protein